MENDEIIKALAQFIRKRKGFIITDADVIRFCLRHVYDELIKSDKK